MKKKILATLIFASMSSGVFAQAKNFEGFNAGLNLSLVGASTEGSASGNVVSFGQQNVIPSVDLGYNFAANENLVLGISGTYDFTSTDGGKVNNATLKMENHYSFNLKPGFVVSPNTMLYATFGYNRGTGKITTAGGTKAFNGFSYGLGALVMVDKNIFVKAEVQRVDYTSESAFGDFVNFKPSSTIGTIGVGYKF